MWRISRVVKDKSVILELSGRFEREHLTELQTTFRVQAGDRILILDLRDITVIDRHVATFLASCQESGIVLRNCPGYVREWMARENKSDSERRERAFCDEEMVKTY